MTTRYAIALLVLLAALTGCSALKQALGLETAQEAPVYVGQGVNMQVTGADLARTSTPGTVYEALIRISLDRTDASGSLGSTTEGKSEGTATQTTSVDPKAVADAANSLIESAAIGSPARLLAEKARAALANGDTAGAAKLVEEAKAASPEAPVSPPTE